MAATTDELRIALERLPIHSLVIIAAELGKTYADTTPRSEEYFALDSLIVEVLNVGEEKLRTDSIGTPFTDLVDKWYQTDFASQAAAWYQAQLRPGQ